MDPIEVVVVDVVVSAYPYEVVGFCHDPDHSLCLSVLPQRQRQQPVSSEQPALKPWKEIHLFQVYAREHYEKGEGR